MSRFEGRIDKVGDLHHVVFAESTRRHGRGSYADAAGFADRFRIEWNCIFVHCDGCLVESGLSIDTSDACGAQIEEKHMVIGAAGHDAVTEHDEAGADRFGIVDDLLGVVAEARLKRFVETHGFGCDDVHEGAALNAWENLAIDFL